MTQLGDQLVRPHDVALAPGADDPDAGRVVRVVRVGFEVRVEVSAGEQVVLATMTRTEFLRLGLDVGATVSVRVVPGAPVVPVSTGGSPVRSVLEVPAG